MRVAILVAACLFGASAAAFPQAKIDTNMGTITVALEADKAPATVANFVRYAKEGHYSGTVIYRVVPGFVVQMGSMGADGKWRPMAKPVRLETAGGLSNTRGTLAMAREDKPASATAEFFINLADTNAQGLDPKPGAAPNTTGFAVFGHVIAGMEVVDAIAAAPIGGNKGPFPANYPKKAVVIRKVTISEVAGPIPPVPPPGATPDQAATLPQGQTAPATPDVAVPTQPAVPTQSGTTPQ